MKGLLEAKGLLEEFPVLGLLISLVCIAGGVVKTLDKKFTISDIYSGAFLNLF